MSNIIHILRIQVEPAPGAGRDFAAWQSVSTTRLRGVEGFMSSESKAENVIGEGRWQVWFRFEDQASLSRWRRSPQWAGLLEELRRLVRDGTEVEVDEFRESQGRGGVTEVIVTKVKPGMMDAYREWEARIRREQSRFEGFLGAYVQPPASGEETWTTLIRFDSVANLNRWKNSPERLDLLTELREIVDYNLSHGIRGSFPGLFPDDPGTGGAPPNWKAALLVLLGLFPIVCVLHKFLLPQLAFLENPSPQTFIANTLSVAFTTWISMPFLIKRFGWWLYPKARALTLDLKGAVLLLVLFAAEIAVLAAMFRWL